MRNVKLTRRVLLGAHGAPGVVKPFIFRTIELVCFVTALAFLIPQQVSHNETFFDAALDCSRTVLFGGSLFALSLCLSLLRDAENWVTFFVKLVWYIGLIWLGYQRANPIVYSLSLDDAVPKYVLEIPALGTPITLKNLAYVATWLAS